MSGGSAPIENSPMIDEIVRTNGRNKEPLGDDRQSCGGRETATQRIATIHAAFMKVAGTGTHTGYVTCPTIVALSELTVQDGAQRSNDHGVK